MSTQHCHTPHLTRRFKNTNSNSYNQCYVKRCRNGFYPSPPNSASKIERNVLQFETHFFAFRILFAPDFFFLYSIDAKLICNFKSDFFQGNEFANLFFVLFVSGFRFFFPVSGSVQRTWAMPYIHGYKRSIKLAAIRFVFFFSKYVNIHVLDWMIQNAAQ